MAQIIPDNLKPIVEKADVGEGGGLEFPGVVDAAERLQMSDALYAWFRLSHKDLLLNYSTSVLSQKEQCIWIEVGEMLPPDEYVDYLNQMLDGFAGGRIPLGAVETALLGRSHKRGFLDYSYDKPSIQNLYTKAITVLPPTSEIISGLKDGKDGKLQKQTIMLIEMSQSWRPEWFRSRTSTPTTNMPTAARPASAASEELKSFTPWRIIVVLAVVITGLLGWVMTKRK